MISLNSESKFPIFLAVLIDLPVNLISCSIAPYLFNPSKPTVTLNNILYLSFYFIFSYFVALWLKKINRVLNVLPASVYNSSIKISK